MSFPRNRIPVETDYLISLGRATYNFTYLEGGVVWLTETINRGFLMRAKGLTAGNIAREFSKAVSILDDSDEDRDDMTSLAVEFVEIVRERNRLLHSNPYSASDGQQRLIYNESRIHRDWTIDLIDTFADRIANASVEVGRLLHGGRYVSWQNAS